MLSMLHKGHRPASMFLALAISWVAVAACTSSTDDDGADTAQSSGAGAGAAQGSGVGGSGAAQSSGVGGAGECGSLTQWEQKMLDAHNSWRSSVEPPAANMYRAYWDVTIAQNAAAWVSSCDPEWPHSSDESRTDIGGYDVLGENLSYCAGTGCNDDPNITDGSGMGDGEGWWAERSDYNWQDDSSTGITSHYTQMVSSNVYAIGCATQLCSAPGPSGWDADWWWTICQYGPRGQGYWNGTKPYDAGDGELVEPPDTVFADHPGLCATQ